MSAGDGVGIGAAVVLFAVASSLVSWLLMRRLRRRREELQSSVVSIVSHELRTPLSLIHGFSELLATGKLDSSQAQAAVAHIHASSHRLSRLIDDLSSVSRIESGGLSIEPRPVDLHEVTSEVVAAFAMQDKLHRFVTDVPEELRSVLADSDKTNQILTNLVANAVKYSPPGSEVRLAARAVGNHAEISVSDQGTGVSDAEAARVFGKFVRSDRPEVRTVGGTGLGLYITKNLVELQGGRIWVQSERGRGSSFVFTLPLLTADRAKEDSPQCGASVERQARQQAVR